MINVFFFLHYLYFCYKEDIYIIILMAYDLR